MRKNERLARLHAVIIHFLGQIGYWEEVRKRREVAGREAEVELRHAVGRWLKLINREVRRGLKTPRKVLAVKKLADWEMLRAEGERMLKRAYLDILIIEASKAGGFAKQFDVLNVEAVEWAAANAGDMVTDILDETVDAIRTHVSDAIAQGKTVFQLTEELKPLAGLNKAQTAAASNYYTKLQTMPKYRRLSPARREAMFDKYVNRMHELRAETIARTESARAVHEGTLMRYEKLGVERIQYLAAPDACVDCATLDGRVYRRADFPDLLHPDCRCGMTPAEKAPEKWKPANSLKEAESWANSKGFYYGKEADLFKGADPSHLNLIKEMGVAFRKMNLELANEFNRQISILELKLKPRYFNKLKKGEIKFYHVNMGRPDNPAAGTITGIYDKLDRMQKGTKIIVDPKISAIINRTEGKYYVDATLGGTIRHELGHALQNVLTHGEYVGLNINLIYTKTGWLPSRYAEMNWGEAWAEWVSRVTKKGFRMSSLPKGAQKKANLILTGG